MTGHNTTHVLARVDSTAHACVSCSWKRRFLAMKIQIELWAHSRRHEPAYAIVVTVTTRALQLQQE